MPEINVLQPLQVQPNRAVLQPGQRPTTAIFFLRATPAIFTAQVPGGPSNMSFVSVPLPLKLSRPVARPGVWNLPLVQTTPALVQVSGLVHSRETGIGWGSSSWGGQWDTGSAGLRVNPQLRASGLTHTRALGALAVAATSVPPIEPPPVTPPFIPPTSPRTLRGVRRRNVEERD